MMVKGVALAPTDGRRGSFASNRWLARPQSDSRSPWTSSGRASHDALKPAAPQVPPAAASAQTARQALQIEATTLDGITKSQEA